MIEYIANSLGTYASLTRIHLGQYMKGWTAKLEKPFGANCDVGDGGNRVPNALLNDRSKPRNRNHTVFHLEFAQPSLSASP
jgi:hypothetical protein